METKYIVKFHSSATESSAKVLNTKVVNLFDDPGCRSIELLDKSTNLAPKNVRVKRAGNDLQVRIDDAAEGPIDLVIKDYYPEGGELVGLNAEGQYVEYVPVDGQTGYASLGDGLSSIQQLSADAAEMGVCVAAVGGSSPWLVWGAAGLGAVALLAAASGGSDAAPAPAPAPAPDTTPPATPATPSTYKDNVGSVTGATKTASVTDDSTPGINVGAGLAGTPNLYVDGVKVPATYDPVTGTLTPNTPLSEGAHSLSTSLTGANGVESAKSGALSLTIDTTAPATPAAPTSYNDNAGTITSATSTAGVTDDTTPGLNIGAGLTDTPSLYVDGVKVPATYDAVTGTLTPTTPLSEGAHALTYTLTDAAGNESAKSPALNLSVDTTAPATPAAPTNYNDNAGSITNPTSTAGVTDDTTPGLNVGAGLTDTPKLYVDGVLTPATYDAATGTLTPTTPLAEGAHTLAYTLTDAAGNESLKSPTLPVTIDTTAPTTPAAPTSYNDDVTAVTNTLSTAAATNDTQPGLNIGAGLTDTPKLYVDGVLTPATYDAATGTLTPTTPLSEGAHALTYTLTDAAGNESAKSPALNLSVDTTAPATPAAPTNYNDNAGSITNPTSTAGVTDDTTPGLNVGAGLTDTPKLYVDGVLTPATYDAATGTLTPTTPLAEGAHTLAYTLTDAADNESLKSPTLPVTIDTTAPTTPAAPTSYNDNAGGITNASSTAPTTDDETPGLNVGVGLTDTPSLYVDGVKVAATYDATTGTLTPTTPLSEGQHTLAYTLTDPAGNTSAQSPALSLKVDLTAPPTPAAPTSYKDDLGSIQNNYSNASTTDDATPGLNIGAHLTLTPTLYVDGVLTPATYDATAGTLTPVTPLTAGQHALSYTLSDPAGNESAPSSQYVVNIDTTSPTTPAAPTSYKDNVGSIQNATSAAATTDDSTPGLNIGVGLTDTPKLYVDGVLVPATYDPVLGTLTPNTALAAGPHALTYTLSDTAGNESTQSPALNLSVDLSAPAAVAAPGSYVDDVGTVQNPTSTAPTTDDTKPGLNIGAGLADTPSLYVDGVKVAATYDSTTGVLTPTVALTEGAHALTYTLTNAAGTEGAQSGALNLTVDTIAPAAPAAPTSYADNIGSSQNTLSTAAVTDDATPGLNIGAGQTSTPSLYVDGTKVAATYDVTTGTLTPTTPLTAGPHALTYTLTDAAGNESPQSPALNLSVDTTAPATPAAPTNYNDNAGTITNPTSTAGVTDDTTPGLNVGAGLTDTPKLYVDGVLTPATYDAATGTLTPTTPLAEGAHTLAYTLTDAAGNESLKSPTLPVSVDTTAPAAPATPTTYKDDVGSVTGAASTAGTTDDTTPGINVGVGLTDTPKLYVDGVLTPATYDAVTGTLTPNSPLSNGLHNFSTTLTDAAGNESAKSGVLPITIDSSAVATPAAPTSYNDDVAAVTNTLSTAAATNDTQPGLNIGTGLTDTPKLYVDGVLTPATYDAVTGTLTPTAPLSEGAHALTYTLTNGAGTQSAKSPALNLSVDTTAPATPAAPTNYNDNAGTITNPTSTAGVTDDTTPGLNVGAGLTDTPKLYVDGVLTPATYDAATGTLTPTTPLAEGAHTLAYTLTDAAGNESLKSPTLPVSVDTTAPTAPATPTTYKDDVGSVTGAASTAGTTDDTTPGINVGVGLTDTPKLYVDGVLTPATYDAVTGTLTPNSPLSNGLHNFSTTLTDAAGNESAKSGVLPITIDSSAVATPAAPTSYNDDVAAVTNTLSTAAATNDTQPGLNIGTGLTDTPKLYVDGVLTPATYDAVTGTLTPTAPLSEGAHALTYTLTNGAGTQSAKSPALNLSVDTTAPATPAAPTNYNDNAGTITNPTSTAGVTDDTTPGLNVGAGLTDTPKLYVDGVLTPATYDAATGTLTPTTPLAEGAHTLAYTLTDAAGNESLKSPTLPVSVDTTAPTAPATPTTYKDDVGSVTGAASTAGTTDDTTPGINVGVGLTDTPKLYVDGVLTPATYDAVTGTLTPNSPLSNGLHNFSTTLTDAAGNESAKSGVLPITIDSSAVATPAAPTSYNDDVAAVTNTLSTAAATNDTQPGLNIGTGLTDTPKLYVDGVLTPATYDAVTGTLTPTAPLSEGAHALTYTLTNGAGTQSAKSPALNLSVDTTAPATPAAPTNYNDNAGTITNPTSTAGVTDDTTPGLNVGAGLTDTPKLYVDGVLTPATYDAATGTLTPTTPLAEGAHTLAYTLTDAAGNESLKSPTLPVSVDTTAPTAPATPTTYKDDVGSVTGAASTAGTTDDTTPGINVGVGLTDTPKLYVDGVLTPATYDAVTGTLTPNSPLSNGLHNFSTTLTDAAGNESAKSGVLPITIDSSAVATPAAPTSYNDDVAAVTNTLSTAAATNDTQPGLNIGTGLTDTPKLYVDGVLTPATYDAVTGTLTPTAPLSEGAHALTYTLTNGAGTQSAKSPALNLSVDTTAPATPAAPTNYNDNAGTITNPTSTAGVTDDTTPGLNVGAGLTDTPKLYVDGVLTPATYDAATGTLTPTTPLAEGAHTLAYTLTDAAGNESLKSPTLPVSVDTTAPTAPATPTTYKDDVGSVTGAASTAGTTDDTTPGINVGVGLTDTPKLYVDGVLTPATYDAVTGTLTPNSPLSNGLHNFSTTLTDAAGNESAKSGVLPITIDSSAVATPAAPTSYNDDVAAVTNTLSTAAATNDTQPGLNIGTGLTDTPKLYVDGVLTPATYDAVTGTLTPTAPLSEGAHALTYTLTNGAGTQSAKSPALNLSVDTTAPATPAAPTNYNDNAGTITNPTSTAGVTDDTTPGLNVGAGLTDTPKLYVDGVLTPATYDAATGTLTPTTPLAEGAHTLAYTLTDAAGNESLKSPTLPVSVDTTAPTAPATPTTYKDDVGSVTGAASTAGTTDDTTPGINVGVGLTDTPKLYVDGVLTPATYDAVTGTLTPNSPLSNGLHNFSTTLTDAAGNESAKSGVLPITIDSSAVATPAAPTSYNDDVAAVTNTLSTAAATNDTQPGLNIGTGLTDTPKLYVDGVLTPATYDAVTGTLTPTAPLSEGAHALTYTLTNGAGTQSAKSPALNLSVDTTAPATPAAPTNYNDNAGTITNPTSTAGVTDDTTPGLNVGAGLTDTPKLYVDGVLTPATYDAATGTLTPTTPLAEGAHTLAYTLTDAAGNESLKSPTLPVSVDTTAPTAPATPTTYKDDVGSVTGAASTAGTTDDTTPGINVGVGLTDTPKLYVDGVLTPATYDAVTGTLTPNSPLSNGLHNFSTTLTDAAGNESAKSGVLPITIDSSAVATPAAPTSYNDDVAAVTNTLSTAAATNDTQPGLNIGTGLTDTPKLYVDGVLTPATYDAVTGTLTPTAPLSEGAHALTYTLTNGAGTESAKSPALNLSVDTTAAAPTLALATDSGTSASDKITNTSTLNVTGLEAGATWQYSLDGGTNWLTGTGTTITGITGDGAKSVIVHQTDHAGNTSADSAALAFMLDTTTATPSMALATDSGSNTSDGITNVATVNVSGLEAGATWQYNVDGGAWQTGTGTSFSATSGNHSYTVRETDVAGNTSAASASSSYTLDTTNATTVTPYMSYQDNVGALQTIPGAWTDATGNYYRSGSTTDDTTPGMAGTLSSALQTGEVVHVYDGGTYLGDATATVGSTTWSYTPATALSAGTHNFTYKVEDLAGNLGTASSTYSITVEPPVTTSADGTASGTNALTSYVDQVTGTDIVSAAEKAAGFHITGKVAGGNSGNLSFYMDTDRTDGVDNAGQVQLTDGVNGVNIAVAGDGSYDITFDANSAALGAATVHNTYGNGVKEFSAYKSGVEMANRLFLVADGTASASDSGTVAQNYSVQDKITGNVFVYYFGDPDGNGVGLWTQQDTGDTATNTIVNTADRDFDSTSWGDWDYYNTTGVALGTPVTTANTALGMVSNVAAQVWEFAAANPNSTMTYTYDQMASLVGNHTTMGSNSSRTMTFEEGLALYAANFGGSSGGGVAGGAASTVGAVQAMTDTSSYNGYTTNEDNRPGGWSGYIWTGAPSPSGPVNVYLGYGHLDDGPVAYSLYAAAVL